MTRHVREEMRKIMDMTNPFFILHRALLRTDFCIFKEEPASFMSKDYKKTELRKKNNFYPPK